MRQHAPEDSQRRRRLLIESSECGTWKSLQVLEGGERWDRHLCGVKSSGLVLLSIYHFLLRVFRLLWIIHISCGSTWQWYLEIHGAHGPPFLESRWPWPSRHAFDLPSQSSPKVNMAALRFVRSVFRIDACSMPMLTSDRSLNRFKQSLD
jgi:hypothetical protein